MKIAIIGSGISGIYAAWKLSKHHHVTIFEKNAYFGGHTDTHDLFVDGRHVAVDSGFIVFNAHNYPLFCAMLNELGVSAQDSDMSFSVNNLVSGLQYNPSKKWSLFTRPQNFANSRFRSMISDLLRFYEANKALNIDEVDSEMTIEAYLDQHGYSDAFREEHLYPMCGALWSSPVEQVGEIPYKFVVSFFQHHRMLQLKDRPQWKTVKGGSATYIRAIQAQCSNIAWQHTAVQQVKRFDDHVEIHTDDQVLNFDWVIFAAHADDCLPLLYDATPLEQDILGSFSYQDNTMVVHRDLSIMPKSRSQWASWHVHVTPEHSKESGAKVHYGFTYWMNSLQNLSCSSQIFSTLNPNMPINPKQVFVTRHYRHPIFDRPAIDAQLRWSEISGVNRTSFCGAYWGWGFHEDGARSAQRVVDQIQVDA